MENFGAIFVGLLFLVFIVGISCITISFFVDKDFVDIPPPPKNTRTYTKPITSDFDFDYDEASVIIVDDDEDDDIPSTI